MVRLDPINLRDLLIADEEYKEVDQLSEDSAIVFEPKKYYENMLATGQQLVASDKKDIKNLKSVILLLKKEIKHEKLGIPEN